MKQLPKIPRTRRSFTCKEVKGEIVYQAFSMGMTSVLLEAKEESNVGVLLTALEHVVEDVLVSDQDIKKIPIHIIEKIFVRARSISLGSEIDLNYTCKKKVVIDENTSHECGGKMELKLDLDTVDIVYNEDFKNVFELEGGYSLKLGEPTIDRFKKLENVLTGETKDPKPTDIVKLFFECIYTDEEVWSVDEIEEEQLDQFIKDLDASVMLKVITDFYAKLPYFGTNIELKCPSCGAQHKTTLRGVQNLFQ
ncbi:baseplate hub subunit [Vibrio phage vB_VchM_Kuja]|uniref:Baseplate hub subunit n=1 Tax=Vibrio phage vB_VchM_Kuja TaxID=2686437 RepID=A0A6B9J9C7_9CAUD|nr:baseplate hub subunit [Vibrio phage vB_VchM_Kuja]QGZ16049.1 baseplate hub subunit [Vibrio phage vB_VchM_Kuja]